MRLALIGQQAFGKSVLDAFIARGDDVAGVFCASEKEGARPDPLRVAAQALGLALFQLPTLKDGRAEEALRGLEVDLAIMAYVVQFAPRAFLTIPRYGTIQYHPSLLPHHRGPSAINWPLIKGESQTGLTIFRPTDGLDEGPVILQKTVAIGPDDTVGRVYFDRLFPLGVDALLEAADLVVSERHQETAQDETAATYEGWCRDAEALINWHSHLDVMYNLIRGCNPSPGAWTTINGSRIRIFDVRKHPARRASDVSGTPGEICAVNQDSIEITGQGGRLEIFTVRPEGGTKTSAAALVTAIGCTIGARLGT